MLTLSLKIRIKMLLRAEKMGFKVNYTSTTGNQAMHNNTKPNLNMDGAELSSRGLEPKKAPAKGLNEAEKILPNHKEAIIKMQIQNAKNEK